MPDKKQSPYLTKEEIDIIETLNDSTVYAFISPFPEEKKQLAMKQYDKECAIKQWKTIARERY